jgi:hypothetical protein
MRFGKKRGWGRLRVALLAALLVPACGSDGGGAADAGTDGGDTVHDDGGGGGDADADGDADVEVDGDAGADSDGEVGSGPIPSERVVPWRPGVPGGLPDLAAACPAGASSVRDFGAVGDGAADDAPAFAAAVAAAAEGGAVRVPAGTYYIRGGLTLDKGVVLCGEGPALSRLEFDGDAPGIAILKYDRGDFVAAVDGLTKGSTALTVADGSGFREGGYAELQQTNDWEKMDPGNEWRSASWVPENCVGQMMRVVSVTGNTLVVDPPLTLDVDPAFDPVVRPLELVEGAGLQGLYLARRDDADQVTVQMKNASRSWMRDCESENTMRAHVGMESALWCEVRDSYFHHAHDYGGGGHGYGVSLGLHVTGVLTENNIFVHLRHAMIAQTGATANVFGYNYSIDPYQSEGGGWTPCDISLHGHYLSGNLFEANTVQEIDVADYWGAAGPNNTFFRNRVQAEGLDVLDYSHGQNVVGNELGGDPNVVTIDPAVTGTLVHGNYEDGAVAWDPAIADRTLPPSLYLTAKPPFFGDAPWPLSGADLAPSSTPLPAQVRYEAM